MVIDSNPHWLSVDGHETVDESLGRLSSHNLRLQRHVRKFSVGTLTLNASRPHTFSRLGSSSEVPTGQDSQREFRTYLSNGMASNRKIRPEIKRAGKEVGDRSGVERHRLSDLSSFEFIHQHTTGRESAGKGKREIMHAS